MFVSHGVSTHLLSHTPRYDEEKGESHDHNIFIHEVLLMNHFIPMLFESYTWVDTSTPLIHEF